MAKKYNKNHHHHHRHRDLFKFFNPNPSVRDTNDCVIRALSAITGKSWLELYDELCAIGRETHSLIDSNDVFSVWLRANKYAYCEYEGRMPTLYQFVASHPKGKYFVIVPGHAVGVVDGKYYDTFDAGDEPVVAFYIPRSAMKHHKHKSHKPSRKHRRHK